MDEKKNQGRNQGQGTSQERGRGPRKDERNSSSSGRGISNPGMDSDKEQENGVVRGGERGTNFERSSGDSER